MVCMVCIYDICVCMDLCIYIKLSIKEVENFYYNLFLQEMSTMKHGIANKLKGTEKNLWYIMYIKCIRR